MAKEFGTSKNFTFLRLNSKGELYQSSKEPKEGFVEITLDDNKKTYQKSYKSTDYGKVIFLGINEKNFPKGKVQYVEMSIQSDDDAKAVDVLQLPLRNTKGGLNDEVKKLVAILPSLDFSKSIIVSSNREKNSRGYVDKVLYFRYKSENTEEKDAPIKFSLKFGEKGNVPMFIVEEDPINPSQKSLNYKAQDAFLGKVLMAELKRFEDFKDGNIYPSEYFREWVTEEVSTDVKSEGVSTTPQSTPTVTSTPTGENPFATASTEVAEDDDSPF